MLVSTLATIRDNVRRNLGEVTPNFYTNADLNAFIGRAYSKYSIMMIEEGSGYFETPTYLNLVSGTATVSIASLSPTFYKIRLLSRVYSDGTTKALERDELRNVYAYKNTVTGDGYLPSYRMQGNNIVLTPPPAASETGSATAGLKLDYFYLPTIPSASSLDAFTFDSVFPTIYEPLIELDATISAVEAKDGMGGVSDIQTFRNERDRWLQTFSDSLYRDENIERVTYVGTNYSCPW
jgi:hypothetical protein